MKPQRTAPLLSKPSDTYAVQGCEWGPNRRDRRQQALLAAALDTAPDSFDNALTGQPNDRAWDEHLEAAGCLDRY